MEKRSSAEIHQPPASRTTVESGCQISAVLRKSYSPPASRQHFRNPQKCSPAEMRSPRLLAERKAGEKLRELEREQGRKNSSNVGRISPYAAALDESGASSAAASD